ncbi:hypothetical protein DICPUDRAFT_157530 [Dictyostelium purpureum]|uniref:Diaminopimelate epimerase n=1 Tax=Dictyostelium purpureum TaxID=5786 RepID=F0ZZC5_DICPU|nr:uncharacterized protein DICPUDRAFT_157530 [Dictyostelium purpureum]EGC30707.1 hypothetical protein DICPUDRAFT_157530 [Dictyostelium purpureum]|eukprot:XP_003292770.1 hypothetical protein DICPUDRAFT_157530 [Dictyostelium purpureum]
MEPINNNNNKNKKYKFNFSKMHGAGNDFVVFHINAVKRLNSDDESEVSIEEISKVTPKISHRKLGIGCDQLIIVDDSPKNKETNFGMHVINCDGVIEMMCGNGVRCASKYLLDNHIKSKSKSYEGNGEQLIETKSGVIKTYPLLDHQNTDYKQDSRLMVKVNMGQPKLVSTSLKKYSLDEQILKKNSIPPKESFVITIDDLNLPYCNKIEIVLVSCGGAHAVVFLDRNIELGYFTQNYGKEDLSKINIKDLADKIQEHPLFLKDTIPNVEFVYQSIKDKEINKVQSRVVERGSGETLACGTGACAVGIAAYLLNYVNDSSDISCEMPGGNLLIQWSSETNETFKTGPAVTLFNSEFTV